jgi:pyruvate formate lyase activating enzyme
VIEINKNTGIIFDLKRFALHDGPGIRTTVFLKGCSLTCHWCHNPESWEIQPEISFFPDRCIGCMACVEACTKGCHIADSNNHLYDRKNCVKCGLCIQKCYARALEMIGKKVSVKEIIREVLKDNSFYDTSVGGITISGGEPMVQFEFTKALLKEAKRNDLHTCLDTSGYAPFKHYNRLMDYVDIFLYDIKETDEKKHKENIGVENKMIIENLIKLDHKGGKIILCCPIIPGFNDRDDHFNKIADLANRLENIMEINIIPFHLLGKSKWANIGKNNFFDSLSNTDNDRREEYKKIIQSYTKVPVF